MRLLANESATRLDAVRARVVFGSGTFRAILATQNVMKSCMKSNADPATVNNSEHGELSCAH